MEEAARWADVVHLEEPFVIEDRMIKICERLGKPVTGTYHLHPENITNSLGPLVHWKGLNKKILSAWRDLTFNHCDYVQCPTENVLDRLRRYHIKARCEVISNGLVPDPFFPSASAPPDPFASPLHSSCPNSIEAWTDFCIITSRIAAWYEAAISLTEISRLCMRSWFI